MRTTRTNARHKVNDDNCARKGRFVSLREHWLQLQKEPLSIRTMLASKPF